MTEWKMTLDLSDKWDAVSDDEMLVPEFCGTIAERLETLLAETLANTETIKRGLRQYADEFKALADDEQTGFEEFNAMWSYFYDWADTDKRLWVKLF